MPNERRLHIPSEIPEDFANAVATVLLLGIAGANAWDKIYVHPPEKSLEWIEIILQSNDPTGLVHAEIEWWEHQLRGHRDLSCDLPRALYFRGLMAEFGAIIVCRS